MKVFDFKKIDFGLLAITLTASALGFILYELTAPFWDDGPPIPKMFIIKRLAWFPICEIICLTSFLTLYRFFNNPSLRNVHNSLVLVFAAMNTSIIICFIGRDIYELHTINFSRYLNNLPFLFLFISTINVISLLCFAFFGVLSLIAEKIFDSGKFIKKSEQAAVATV